MANNNDFITTADLANEHGTFVNKLGSVCNPDFRALVNKDLVGDPLNVGIYDETTGEVVKATVAEDSENSNSDSAGSEEAGD